MSANKQYVFETDNYIYDRQYMAVRYSLCRSETVCHRQSVSITDSLCLSHTFIIYHILSVSVTDSLFLSQTVSICHRKSVSVTDSMCVKVSLCLSQTLLLNVLGGHIDLVICKFCQDLSMIFEFVNQCGACNILCQHPL